MNSVRPLRAPAASAAAAGPARPAAARFHPASGQIVPAVLEGRNEGVCTENALPPGQPSESAIRDWCLAYIGRTVDDPTIAIGPEIAFAQMGLDSATAAYFIVELEEWLGAELEPELVFDYPTIAELARHIVGRRDGAG
jgi:acyl carrier protein